MLSYLTTLLSIIVFGWILLTSTFASLLLPSYDAARDRCKFALSFKASSRHVLKLKLFVLLHLLHTYTRVSYLWVIDEVLYGDCKAIVTERPVITVSVSRAGTTSFHRTFGTRWTVCHSYQAGFGLAIHVFAKAHLCAPVEISCIYERTGGLFEVDQSSHPWSRSASPHFYISSWCGQYSFRRMALALGWSSPNIPRGFALENSLLNDFEGSAKTLIGSPSAHVSKSSLFAREYSFTRCGANPAKKIAVLCSLFR